MGAERTTTTLDRLDRQIIHALQCNGRASFRLLADVLGSSEQTVARRYRRLREAGVMRVIAIESGRFSDRASFLRIGVRPAASLAFAELLSARRDVSWVNLMAGGSEVVAIAHARDREEHEGLLLQRLPRSNLVLSIAAHTVLHDFSADRSCRWSGFGDPLDAGQIAALRSSDPSVAARDPGAQRARQRGAEHDGARDLQDERLLDLLMRDGRASYAELAADSGQTEAQVARRIDARLAAGTLVPEVDTAPEPLGFHASAILWMTVPPSDLAAVGAELASHPEIAFAAAVTGPASILATVRCRDTEHLYRYVSEQISTLGAVRELETSPILRRLKQKGTLMDGDLLPRPT